MSDSDNPARSATPPPGGAQGPGQFPDLAALAPFPDCSPDFLRAHFPIWPLAVETPWLQLGLIDACLALGRADPVFTRLAASLAAWTFQQRPLDAKLAKRLRAARLPGLPPAAVTASAFALAAPPEDQAELFEHLELLPDEELVLKFLRAVLPLPGLGPLWLGRAFPRILSLSDPEQAMALIRSCPLDAADPALSARHVCELAYHRLGDALSQSLCRRLEATLFAPYAALVQAMLALRRGDRAQAAARLFPLWRAMPWNVNLALTLSGLLSPPPRGDLDSGDTAVCVYTWNKAGLLGETLASLAASDLGACPVVVLDNGSSDATGEVIGRAKSMFPPDRFTTLRLPVNVGAPGARNWLLSLPEVASRAYAAFLDDDVILPPDWLVSLRGAARAHPQAGAVGCRIVDAAPPYCLQSADFNILPPDMGEQTIAEVNERIFMCNNSAGLPDNGLFSYTRTCLSVSGCVHLVNLAAVRDAGGFDVAFSPTQFDDLARDLKSWLAGYPALFHGALAVRHVQNSSLRQAANPAQVAHITGNKFKLESRFSDADAAGLVKENQETLWREFAIADAKLRAHAT